MKSFPPWSSRENRVCPWWLAWTFDNPLRRFLQDPERIVGPYLKKGMTAADIGCGMGYFSVAMAKLVGEQGNVISVDLQAKMLAVLRKRTERAGIASRVRTVLASADDIGIHEPVDFVLAFWMVHEVNDIPRFLRQVSAVLKRTGTFLIVEPAMHVSRKEFRQTLVQARAASFHVNDTLSIRFSRSVLLSIEEKRE